MSCSDYQVAYCQTSEDLVYTNTAAISCDDPVLAQFMGKLERVRPHLFYYVLYEYVQSTNNVAEKGLREPVVHRKVRGATGRRRS